MKKIATAVALMLAVMSAGAQTAFDAYNFSKTNYAGTARSMALGNAMTALGGDIGAIVLNPAGSAVFNYSVVSLTPSVAVSSVRSSYSPEGEMAFGPVASTSKKQFNVPNAGAVFVLNSDDVGLKGWSFSIVCTQTDNALNFSSVSGHTNKTSLLGSLASRMDGIAEEWFAATDAYTRDNHVSWDLANAYKSGQVSNMFRDFYIGGNQLNGKDSQGRNIKYVPDYLSQNSEEYYYGTKNDILLNTAMNFNDNLYFGVTMGIPVSRYRYTSNVYEAAENPLSFPVKFEGGNSTYFKSASYGYNYSADYNGIYAKLGLIYRPVSFLRFGLTFQSPTLYAINEFWNYTANVRYDNNNNGSATSPDGQYSYCLRSPYQFSFGAALTLGNLGFISADYEMADYSIMSFRERHGDYNVGSAYSTFGLTNEAISNFYGVSHALRIGAEIRVGAGFSLRGGYGFTTDPSLLRKNSSGYWIGVSDYESLIDEYHGGGERLSDKKYTGDKTSFFSFGLGYSSAGSFFADLAAKKTTFTSDSYILYDNYYAFDSQGDVITAFAPAARMERSLWNVSLTLGWRF